MEPIELLRRGGYAADAHFLAQAQGAMRGALHKLVESVAANELASAPVDAAVRGRSGRLLHARRHVAAERARPRW